MSHSETVDECGKVPGLAFQMIPSNFLDIRNSQPTIASMEISLAPELEERLARVASEAGKAANQIVQERTSWTLTHGSGERCKKGWPHWTAASLYRTKK